MEKLIPAIAEFNKVTREIDNAYHLASVKMGISDSERDILYFLSQQPLSQMDISNMTGLSKQTINSSVRKMINEGYLEPLKGTKNEKLSLTDKGIERVEHTVNKLIKIENKIFSNWTQDEQTKYINLNNQYLKMFRDELEEL